MPFFLICTILKYTGNCWSAAETRLETRQTYIHIRHFSFIYQGKAIFFFFFFSESDCRNCELNLSFIYSSDVPSCQWQVHGRIDSTKIRNIARTGRRRRRRRRRKSTSPNQAERIIYNTYTCVQLVYTCQI